MLHLHKICIDLNDSESILSKMSISCIQNLFDSLKNPSRKTEDIIKAWKEEFSYIYGDVRTNLSSNSKLDEKGILKEYGIDEIETDLTENVQMLFFAIQTYFSLLIKTIMKCILDEMYGNKENSYHYEELILGGFALKYGIKNYCYADWYCFPVFELENGCQKVCDLLAEMTADYQIEVSVDEFVKNHNFDYIKQMYEAVIPKELRHALGEYYTPDWLAQKTLKDALQMADTEELENLKMLDPTCGSGTFLIQSILYKRKVTKDIRKIVDTVTGFDINPLAVLTAKTNYLLSVMDLVEQENEITLPIYNVDIIRYPETLETDDQIDFLNAEKPSYVIKNLFKMDRNEAIRTGSADLVMGNPPWVNWEYLPEVYRKSTQHLWYEYKLFSARGRALSFSKEDISVLITYIVIDKLLKKKGILAFVIRQGVFKSAQNGAGFRRFSMRDHEYGIKVLQVDDLSKIRPFDHAMTSTAIFYARKGEDTKYPVPYFQWKKSKVKNRCFFNSYSSLEEVLEKVEITKQSAMPAVEKDSTSLWLTAESEQLLVLRKALGTNPYKARTGVFTGGANAVYWMKILKEISKNEVQVANVVERAKRKVESITDVIEKDYIFPMVKGSNVSKWKVTTDTYLLCPHTIETKIRPVPQEILIIEAPKTFQYLFHFKEALDQRNGFAGWEREIQKKEFHAILRIGEYTFSKYKVIWRYIASEFICAVISEKQDEFLGRKMILPNEKIVYISTEKEAEAYYLCALLSSSLISKCVKGYMNPTSISAHVLEKLNLPAFDETNTKHMEMAGLCKSGHGKKDISGYIEKIDAIVNELYGLGK